MRQAKVQAVRSEGSEPPPTWYKLQAGSGPERFSCILVTAVAQKTESTIKKLMFRGPHQCRGHGPDHPLHLLVHSCVNQCQKPQYAYSNQ